MDARAVAAAAGIEVTTLDVWVHRGRVPGMEVGVRGRQRDFDLQTATGVLLLAELVRFGLGVAMASQIVLATRTVAETAPAKWLLVTCAQSVSGKVTVHTTHMTDDSKVLQGIGDLCEVAEHLKNPEPDIFVLINLEALAAKMRAAQEALEMNAAA